MKAPLVSIIVPTYHRPDDLRRLITSVNESDYPQRSLELIVVDNGRDPSTKPAVRQLRHKAVVVTPGDNLYSNGARRIGAAAARGDYIFLLDDDNVLEASCISMLVATMQEDDSFGAVGPLMLDGDSDMVWSAGARISPFGLPRYVLGGMPLSAVTEAIVRDIDYFPNACMVRRQALEQAPLDDAMFPHNWAETDFCLRIIEAGYEVVCVTAAIDRHFIGYSGFLTRLGIDKTYDQAKSRILFRRRHMHRLLDWLRFWLVVFPVSTAVYVWRIVRTPGNKIKILAAYIRGTRDGLNQPLRLP